ncbi:hypothetical protein [Catenuloplanes indicus]|uniref:Uncharacterized protein n=1 Tax=Catenuloplanes indicus TaxID=137267 RepID=A0AAE3VVH7_9ACTN|nr:hypothetical protein [Catenuloplanes indicus]MDQ0364581.1 hypothetical protein [Catenuloplanes indicus]
MPNDDRRPAGGVTPVRLRYPMTVALLTLAVLSLAAWQWRLAVQWWEHDLDGTTQVGPFSVRDWARIGKVAQFMAGFTVLLDVIGPKRILAIAAEVERYRQNVLKSVGELRRSQRIAAQWSELFGSLLVARGEGDGGPLWHYEAAGTGPPRAVLPSVAQDGLDGWHRAAVERLGRPHDCDVDHELSPVACDWQVDVTRAEVDRYLTASMPELMDKDLDVIRASVSAVYLRMAIGSLAIGAVIALAIGFLLYEVVDTPLAGPVMLGVIGAAAALFGVLVLTNLVGPSTSRWGTLPLRCYLWILTAPTASLVRACGTVLGRYHEGQSVKLVALGVFVLGWLLDFLAA